MVVVNNKTNSFNTNVQFVPAKKAIQKIQNRDTIMVGGFGLTGLPEYLLKSLAVDTQVSDLEIISNNIQERSNLYKVFQQGRIKKAIGTYFTTSKEVVKSYNEGSLEIELLPQGTFTEAFRLGAAGIPAFYTPTSAGTELARGKESRIFNGKEHVLERTLVADVALIKAYKADKAGNVIYRKSARNFNPLMAMAAKLTIIEVEEIVEVGELNPEEIVTPFIFVDMIVKRKGV